MRRRISETELRRQCRNEDAHTDHVAALALALFDAAGPAEGLEPGDRPLLERAARLHDIGFARDPDAHAERGARIVRSRAIRGLPPAARGVVAAAIALHPRRCPDPARSPWLAALGPADRRRALNLAAFLRVADALDHGHVQDAAIRSVETDRRTIRVQVRCGAYPGNVPCANAKADLWNRVLPVPVRILAAPDSAPAPWFGGVLRKRDSAPEALRKILCLQGRLMADARAGALSRTDPEDLHDLRVAMRRFRAALRLYRREWPDRQAPALIRDLFALSTRVGPIRDRQVWLEFLQEAEVRRRCARDRGWARLLRAAQRDTERSVERLRRILAGPAWHRPAARVVRYLRVDLPEMARTLSRVSFRSFGAEKLRRLYRRILGERVRRVGMRPEEYHALRRLCRRGRYTAEFLAPVAGPAVDELARRLKAVCDALGRLHDADVHRQRLPAAASTVVPSLQAVLMERRDAALEDFRAAWKELRRREGRRAALGRLDELARNR